MYLEREKCANPRQPAEMLSGRQVGAGAISGAIAGLVMALAMMGYMHWSGRSIWTNPNLIAVMWLGEEAAIGGFSAATLIGFSTHMATSVIMGIVALPFMYALPPWRTMLAAFAYAVASYPVVFAGFLTWLNPLMVERYELVPMTVAHALFGVVLGGIYLALRPDRAGTSRETRPGTTERQEEKW